MSVALVEQPIFVKKKHELANLLLSVQKVSKDAIELIANTMNSTEETVSQKTKLECARFLLEFEVKVSDTISKDQLVRQVAEIKAKGLITPLGEVGEGERKRVAPTKDFTKIQEV